MRLPGQETGSVAVVRSYNKDDACAITYKTNPGCSEPFDYNNASIACNSGMAFATTIREELTLSTRYTI